MADPEAELSTLTDNIYVDNASRRFKLIKTIFAASCTKSQSFQQARSIEAMMMNSDDKYKARC